MDFIAPRILKEDIETIWKMQVKRSLKVLLSIKKGFILFSMVVP
jgi:hypothetical protein